MADEKKGLLDPYHFKVDPEVTAREIEGPEDDEFQHDPWIPLAELIARGNPLPLREHYGEDAVAKGYNPRQPRDRNGRWTSGGSPAAADE